MQGSLEQPPILIRASRWKAALVIVVSAGFMAIGVMMLVDWRPEPAWHSQVVLAVFGFGLIIGLGSVLWPSSLEISPAGLALRVLFRRRRWRWNEIGNFRVIRIERTGMVGFDVADGQGGASRLKRLNSYLVGVDGALPAGWPVPAESLATLLNEARARWLPVSAMAPTAPPASRTPRRRDPPPIVR
jgi:hypothetical protein